MNFCVTEQPYLTFTPMTEIHVKVEPGSDEFRVEYDHIPKIHIEAPAENGRANEELKRRIEEVTGEKTGIVSGHRSRRKKIVTGLPEEELREKLRDIDG